MFWGDFLKTHFSALNNNNNNKKRLHVFGAIKDFFLVLKFFFH